MGQDAFFIRVLRVLRYASGGAADTVARIIPVAVLYRVAVGLDTFNAASRTVGVAVGAFPLIGERRGG